MSFLFPSESFGALQEPYFLFLLIRETFPLIVDAWEMLDV